MDELQARLVRAAKALGLRVEAPWTVELGEGRTLAVQVYLPDLGGPKGMLVASSDVFTNLPGHVLDEYGWSVLSEPTTNADYETEGCAEMFTEWGWSAASPKPAWMSGRDEETGRRIKRLRRVVTVLDDADLIDEVTALAPFVGIFIREGTANHKLLAWSQSLPENVLPTTFGSDVEAATLIDLIETHHAGHEMDPGFEFDGPADELDLWFLASAEEDRRRIIQELEAIGAWLELMDPSRIRARVVYSD
jgi:hypothetical protein